MQPDPTFYIVKWCQRSWHGGHKIRTPMGADRLCASKEDAFWKLLELEAKWPYETFRLMTLDEWNKETAHDV